MFFAVLTTLAVLGTAILNPPSASAHHGKPWHAESDMINSSNPYDRGTLVIDPGRGSTLSRGQLLPHMGLYDAFGYTPNFLWYAPQKTLTVSGATSWAGCDAGPRPALEPCPITEIDARAVATIKSTFGRDTTLQLLEHKGHFIALACGNFRTHSNPRPDRPIPSISGQKFHDQSRDGAFDSGEPGLGGWEIVITRVESHAGQGTHEVARLTTDGNGHFRFVLDGHGPGVYTIQEVQKDGWVRTTPEVRTVVVPFGAADTEYGANNFGNVESRADVVKADFRIVDAPERIEADAPTSLTVRATLRNDGPANPVDVADVMTSAAPPDCTMVPQVQGTNRRLYKGVEEVVDFIVTVTCTEPSHHRFSFANDLAIQTARVEDPQPENNHREVEAVIPVFDRADVHVVDVNTACDAASKVDTAFDCTVTTAVANAGSHPEANTDVELAITVPADCTATPTSPTTFQDVLLRSEASRLSTDWSVTCGDRSFHPVSGASRVTVDHLHVEDPETDNNAATSTQDVVEVFEDVDLVIDGLDLTCERADAPGSYACGASMAVRNAGPADAVKTLTSLALTTTPGCSTTPTSDGQQLLTLLVTQATIVSAGWHVQCVPATDAVLTVSGLFRNADDEPHAVDTATASDAVRIRGGIIDIKPRSFPSAVNPDKQGTVPVAILSNAGFDAFAEVDQSTLRFGASGIEESFVRCGGVREDVNDDGVGDLVCSFDTQLTGLTCDNTVGYLTARLRDESHFEAVGDVFVTPCRRK